MVPPELCTLRLKWLKDSQALDMITIVMIIFECTYIYIHIYVIIIIIIIIICIHIYDIYIYIYIYTHTRILTIIHIHIIVIIKNTVCSAAQVAQGLSSMRGSNDNLGDNTSEETSEVCFL